MTVSAILVSMLWSAIATAAPAETQSFFHDVELREGATADIHAAVLVNPSRPKGARTVVAVHGFAHTGEMFRPLAETLFASTCPERTVSRFVIVDLPGHGQSSLPSGIPFGDLTLSDYASAVLGVLAELESEEIRTDVLLTGDPIGSGFFLVEGQGAVRGAHVADPAALVSALCSRPL